MGPPVIEQSSTVSEPPVLEALAEYTCIAMVFPLCHNVCWVDRRVHTPTASSSTSYPVGSAVGGASALHSAGRNAADMPLVLGFTQHEAR